MPQPTDCRPVTPTSSRPTALPLPSVPRVVRLVPYLLAAITLAGAGVRFYRLGDKGLWLDEAFSVWMSSHSLPDLYAWLVRIDQHPPLYYTLLHFWLYWGDDPAHIRLLSALFSTLVIPVIFLIARRIAGPGVGLIAALILAFSPFQVRFAQETRMYALLTLNVALAVLALVHLLTDPRAAEQPIGSRLRRASHPVGWPATDLAWLGYMVFTAATVLTHNTAVFFPLAANLYVLALIAWRRQGKLQPAPFPAPTAPDFVAADFAPPSLRNWVWAQAGALLLWLPWSAAAVIQAAGVYNQFWIQPPTLSTVVSAFFTLVNDSLPYRFGGIQSIWVIYGVLLALGIFGLRRRPWALRFLLALMLVPFAGELLVSLRRPIFYDRTLIWTTLPLAVLLAVGVAQLRWRSLMLVTLVAVAAANLLSIQNYYDNFRKEEWREAAAYVAQKLQPGDLILFNATWVQIPFDYYFHRYNRPLDEHGVPVDLFGRGLEPQMQEADMARLRSLVQGHARVWLVYSHDWYTDPKKLVPATLEEQFDLEDSQHFYGLELRLYQAP